MQINQEEIEINYEPNEVKISSTLGSYLALK